MILGCVGGWFILELGEFGANRGAVGEVTDDEGQRGIGGDARRGDACWEVGAKMFPEAVSFKAAGTEFSPVHCILVALLVLVSRLCWFARTISFLLARYLHLCTILRPSGMTPRLACDSESPIARRLGPLAWPRCPI